MLRDAVFVFQLDWICACFSLSKSAFSWECLLTFCGVAFSSISSLASLSSLWIFSRVPFQYGLSCRLPLGIDSFAALRTAELKLEAFLLTLCLEKVIN